MDANQTIVDVFQQACKKYPDSPIYTALGQTLSFAELDQLSSNFAAYLQHQTDLEVGDRVAVQLPNLLQYPVAAFGVLKAGLTLVNTNPLYTERELAHQLKDSGARGLVVLDNFAATAASVLAHTEVEFVFTSQVGDMHKGFKRLLLNAVVKYIKRAVPDYHISKRILMTDAIQRGSDCSFRPLEINPDSIAVLQYTGGTTGVAKGAMLSHANLVANMQQVCEHLPEVFPEGQEIFAAPLPLYHIYAFTMHMLCSMCTGNHSVLIPNPREIESIVKVFKAHRISAFIGLNTLYNALLNDNAFRALDFSALKNCSAGGMALTTDTAQRWTSLTGCPILEGYGLTEASPVISSNRNGEIKAGSIGKVLPHTEVKIADDEGNEVPEGHSGELLARGPQVMLGYWQRPDETEKVMTEDGWLKTGDIAQIDREGYIKIVDRKKDMILVSGFKVFPNEVEDVASLHPGILECAAIGVPDSVSGEVVKLVVVKADEALKEEEIRSFCRERLTGYKIPKHIIFMSELPKSNVGKVLRRELRDRMNA